MLEDPRCLSRWGGLFLPRGSEGSSCCAHQSCLGTGDRKDVLRLVASLEAPRERKRAFIRVPDCVPTATGQEAVYRAQDQPHGETRLCQDGAEEAQGLGVRGGALM